MRGNSLASVIGGAPNWGVESSQAQRFTQNPSRPHWGPERSEPVGFPITAPVQWWDWIWKSEEHKKRKEWSILICTNSGYHDLFQRAAQIECKVLVWGLPWQHSGWESTRQCRGLRFIPGLGRSHVPQGNWAYAPQLLGPCSRAREPQLLSLCSRTREATTVRIQCT